MKSEAGTEIDVIALDGGKPCLFPRLRSGICPDQGETVLGRCDAARVGQCWLPGRVRRAPRVSTLHEFSG